MNWYTTYFLKGLGIGSFVDVKVLAVNVHMVSQKFTNHLTYYHFSDLSSTTGTACQPVAKYPARLLSALAQKEFPLIDSFDGVSRIHDTPKSLLDQGYSYVSFDVKSLFTNIPMKKVTNIILKRVYDEKLMTT